MSKILCDRRHDSDAVAGGIDNHVAAACGGKSIFVDIGSTRWDLDFRERVQEANGETDILLAVSGPEWTGTRRRQGNGGREGRKARRKLTPPTLIPRFPRRFGSCSRPPAASEGEHG